jgi:hypothetical protein
LEELDRRTVTVSGTWWPLCCCALELAGSRSRAQGHTCRPAGLGGLGWDGPRRSGQRPMLPCCRSTAAALSSADRAPLMCAPAPHSPCPRRKRCSALQWNPEVATQVMVASDDDMAPSLQVSWRPAGAEVPLSWRLSWEQLAGLSVAAGGSVAGAQTGVLGLAAACGAGQQGSCRLIAEGEKWPLSAAQHLR